MNQWQKLLDYINSNEIGETITRQKMLWKVYGNPKQWKAYSRATTIDRYRRILTILGILERVDRGKYKVLYHVNKEVPSHKFASVAYKTKRWKEWFMKKEDFLKDYIITEDEDG